MSTDSILNDEINILYAASHKLAKASSPAEQLEAVSDYARATGAASGMLLYIDHDDDNQPAFQEVVANWLTEGSPMSVGTRIPVTDRLRWIPTPDHPLFINDTLTSSVVPLVPRNRMYKLGYRGCVILPLRIKGRLIGILGFNWVEPREFTEADNRIYTALIQQASPVVDSMRLFEQMQRRASELEIAKNEIGMLYAASNKLTQAATPAEFLEAISDYARENGAAAGFMTYLPEYETDPLDWSEITAEWAGDDQSDISTAYHLANFGTNPIWIENPNMPLLIEDISQFSDNIFIKTIKSHYCSLAVLPLQSQGRWVGLVIFAWNTLQHFTESDHRIYTTLIQQMSPIIDSVQLFEQNQRRAARAEHLLKINVALSQATSEAEIVAAVAGYARLNGGRGIILNYLDVIEVDNKLVQYSNPVAIWQDGDNIPYDEARHRTVRLADFGYADLWYHNPEQALLIENINTDPRIPDKMREQMLVTLRSRAIATIPLFNGGRCQGVMSIFWFEPHQFSDQERYIYTALIQTLSAVVASRRAYLSAEEIRRESEFLYRMSEAINAATSFEEIVQAVADVDTQSEMVSLNIWENYDYDTATYIEVKAAMRSKDKITYITAQRFPIEAFPIAKILPRQGLWIIEDTLTDSDVDAVTANTFNKLSTRAMIGTPISVGNRWIGGFSFHSSTPHRYTDQEKRIAAGIGDLVLAAVERMRLQAETEFARQQAETIARVNAALSQSADEQAILAALSQIAEQHGAALSLLAYTNQSDRIDIVGLRSADGSSPLPLSFLPITSFSFEDYPILQLAYNHPDEVLFIEDTLTDSYLSTPQNQAFVKAVNWGAVILMPLKSADQSQGIFTFAWSEPQVFKPEIRELLTALRPTAASVVTSRRAYLAEQEARHETEKRARELAALEERTRLARELHDSVSQALYGIGLGARTARTLLQRDPSRLGEPLDYILSLAEAGLTEMRALIFELRPESLEQEGLITALSKQASSLQARHNIRVQTRFCEEPLLPLDVKESLYRIAREALHNTVKHAQANQINLSLTHEDEGYRLEIVDNGIGFDASGSFPGHLGLKSMRERIRHLNGTFDIQSAPGDTRISATIPYIPEDEFGAE